MSKVDSGSAAEHALIEKVRRLAFYVHDSTIVDVPLDDPLTFEQRLAGLKTLMASSTPSTASTGDVEMDLDGNWALVRGHGEAMRSLGEIFADEMWEARDRLNLTQTIFPSTRALLDAWLESRDAHNADRTEWI